MFFCISFFRITLIYSFRKKSKREVWRRPQLDSTIEGNSKYIVRFLSFLLRTLHAPVEKYPVILHPEQKKALLELEVALSSDVVPDKSCHMLFHSMVWSILSFMSDDSKRDSLRDPFTLFLIASHVQKSSIFAHISRFPPAISMAQWCLRATAVKQIILLDEKYSGNDFQ